MKLEPRNKLLTQAKFLARRFEPMDMTKVLNIIFMLEVENDSVFFKGVEKKISDLCCELFSKHHAKTVVVWFNGGPPNNPEWFEGSLYQFVVDRIMLAITKTRVGVVIRQLKIIVEKTK